MRQKKSVLLPLPSHVPQRSAPFSKAAQKTELLEVKPQKADLPFSYNETKLVLLVRDPFWAYGYWDFSSPTWDWIKELYAKRQGIRAALRVYNLDLGKHFDLEVSLEAKNWYLHLGQPNTSFEAELGLLDSDGHFYSITKSNRIRTPRNGPSEVVDPKWKADAEDFEMFYRLSGGGQTGKGSEFFSRFKTKKS